ncbi:MAG: hypothetical protein ACI9TH_003693, partial [Kiritimatiellia bacterium]
MKCGTDNLPVKNATVYSRDAAKNDEQGLLLIDGFP